MRRIVSIAVVLLLAAAAQAAPIVLDNGDAGTGQQGDFYYKGGVDAPRTYQDDNLWAGPNASAPSAYYGWQINTATPGATYDVYATWVIDRQLSPYWQYANSAADFTVVNGSIVSQGWPDWNIIPIGSTTSVTVDQSVNAAGFDYDERGWFKLATITANGPQVSVILTNFSSAEGPVLADAILINEVPEPATLALLGLGAFALIRRKR